MKNPWTLVKKNIIFQNKFGYTIRDDDVITPAGKPGKFLIIEHTDYAVVIAVTPDKKIIMVRQWRFAKDSECLELPAGSIEDGEKILDAAKRELLEETGYSSDDWQELKSYNSGLNTMKIKGHVFLARNAVLTNVQQPDDTENIEVEAYTYQELEDMMEKNIVNNEYTLLSLMLAKKYL